MKTAIALGGVFSSVLETLLIHKTSPKAGSVGLQPVIKGYKSLHKDSRVSSVREAVFRFPLQVIKAQLNYRHPLVGCKIQSSQEYKSLVPLLS